MAEKESFCPAEKLAWECKINAPGLKKEEGFRQTHGTFSHVSKEGVKGGGVGWCGKVG